MGDEPWLFDGDAPDLAHATPNTNDDILPISVDVLSFNGDTSAINDDLPSFTVEPRSINDEA